MSRQPRQMPPSSAYYAVPQSPGPRSAQGYHSQYSTSRHPTRTPSASSNAGNVNGRGDMAQEVATGAIGAGYGPYSHTPMTNGGYNASRFSAAPSEVSTTTAGDKSTAPLAGTSNTVPAYLWDTKDPDLDDALHNPDPIRDAALDRSFTLFSARGWANAGTLFILAGGIIALFAGYPIAAYYNRAQLTAVGYNYGGINGSGQIADLPGMPSLIDPETPQSAYAYTGTDGKSYKLVFSDEFNTDGRTFYPGDDPYWEAVDLHYWPTGDLEWYSPDAITTQDGKLVITLSELNNHDLNFQSGMLQGWNKFCFTTGYVEVSISMPGSPSAPGLWPGAWTMGNLGRAGYGATTDGTWPYSYDSCDLGTFPNQTAKDGTPAAAATGGNDGGPLSYLPGQRVSACTCPGSDHPGPSVNKGRNAPEIDIIETQIDTTVMRGEVSQSFQTAPYNLKYQFQDQPPATTIYDSSITQFNTYKGGPFQQAMSAVTYIDSTYYGGGDGAYAPYGFEWWSDPNNRNDGYITWFSNGQKTWTLTAASIGPDSQSEVSQRIIPEEPMYLILNLGMSPQFQPADYKHLVFPSKMYFDYVRVYQREDVDPKSGIGCSPKSHPTEDYIQEHLNAYSNPNLTTWEQAGYTFPRNSLYDGC
ncbi:beta-glucan synthesis-associated [Gloeophyllum trabeum ATCC 11539]|uniref:Beta-glucan synthesis-associated n=1 Tax=Gloeophyllum trabeum (strain ATCC 11539 / FP-39264 / Madison 617) TaxID=670483 RepID=S7RF17_GLOTA|nr:beta-glucan synthesis-associated [Gloeophyllum trabeum ATCC 11539]EPQ51074.1 beta-glucan synthesis-associated [Gloeophyllum trabeum ATCC 11539]